MNDHSLRFSTDNIPEKDRMPYWREVFGRCIVRADIQPLTDAPFHGEAVLAAMPDLRLMHAHGSNLRGTRTRALAADGNDDVILFVFGSGSGTGLFGGREITMQPGDAVLYSSAEFGFMNAAQASTFSIPLALMKAMVPTVEDLFGKCVARDNPVLRLLTDYAGRPPDALAATPELAQAVSLHIRDLVALALGAATRDATETALGRGVRAARLRAIKNDILNLLDRHALSIDDAVKRHGLSEPYIRKLFAAEGTSFTEYVTQQRLNRAWRMLRDPRLQKLSISLIAYDAGFHDLSYFNRVFRKRYGMTPSDARAGRT
ncbi:MAG: AraC family transcriptional regulator [Methylobacillus sp.]|jgi:AraC-like DNA-binding protein|nr:AraC family transcriptional regulator [Methylobacillus sp.]